MRVEHLSPQLFDEQCGTSLQNTVYAMYARTDGIAPKSLVTTFAKGDDKVIYLVAHEGKDLIGHMHLEIGTQTFVHEVADIPKAQQLCVASGFTAKIDLERQTKLDIQSIFWKYAWVIAEIFYFKDITVILGDRSEDFAKKTGYNFTTSIRKLNWESSVLTDLSMDYPGYWKIDEVNLWNVRQ